MFRPVIISPDQDIFECDAFSGLFRVGFCSLEQLTDVGLELEYVDTGVKRGKTYYYQVRAVNAVGGGTATEQTSVEVPEKDDTGDDGTPWWVYAAIIVVIIVLLAVAMMMRGGRGGPEASAPMTPEKESESSSTPAPTLVE